MLLPRGVSAQFTECPFPPSLAVADTLDPAGYLPLETGNVWEYVQWSVCCLDRATRSQVVGDTLVNGAEFKILSESHAYFDEGGDLLDPSTVVMREVERRYLTLREGKQVEWTAKDGETVLRDLSMAFQSCAIDPDSGTLTVAWELSATALELKKTGALTEDAPIGKALDEGGVQRLFQYGLGYISGTSTEHAEVLTYARVGELEWGQALVEVVGTEEVPPMATTPGEFQLVNYPNPFASSTSLDFFLPSEGRVTIRIVDVLGRQVDTPLRDDLMAKGRHKITWNAGHLGSGTYFVQLIHENRVVATKGMVLAH